MSNDIFLSICVPSYNRPTELIRLLESIDYSGQKKIEVVVCEDKAPLREQVRNNVKNFEIGYNYIIRYYENEENYGYDKNLRTCVEKASGKWIMFMGDDDVFVENQLDLFVNFLERNEEIGYVLRSYRMVHSDGRIENFVYYNGIRYWDPGKAAYIELFRRSVFISGFTILREPCVDIATDKFDGTLLYQLYLQAEVCMKYKSAYYDVPFTQLFEGGVPYFGNSESEKDLYSEKEVTCNNSINFIKQFSVISRYLDSQYNLQTTKDILTEMSKYSYPILEIQRHRQLGEFLKYHKALCEIGLNCTVYYYIYLAMLIVLGAKLSNKLIYGVKKKMRVTPHL